MRKTNTVADRAPAATARDGTVLKVEDLHLYFRVTVGVVQAVEGVSFELARGRTLAVLGESGCGKTSLAKAILRLLPRNVDTYTGRVFLEGRDVMKFSE
ncbi:MAG: ATP-binding cassette domain-containing protein, partial [Anaerolineales bacterium]